MHSRLRIATAAVAVLVAADAASAKLLYGTSGEPGKLHSLDVNTLVENVYTLSTPVLTNGLASDNVGQRLYVNQGSTLYTFDYNGQQVGAALPLVMASSPSLTISFKGLAFNSDDSKLYAVRENGTNNRFSGLWEIDQLTGYATNVVNGGTAYNFQGVDYDAANDRFIAVAFRVVGGSAQGIYALKPGDPTPIQLLTGLPPVLGEPADVDGLALNGNTAYLTFDDTTSIYPLDLGTLTYGTPIASGIVTTGSSGGGTWAPAFVPEPASTLVLAGLAGLALRRRRA